MKRFLPFYFILFFGSGTLFANIPQACPDETICGPATSVVGEVDTYTLIDDVIFTSSSLVVTNGSVSSFTRSGVNYTFTITWSAAGTGTISVSVDSSVPVKSVTIGCPYNSPTTPSPTFTISTNACGAKTITYTGTPPTGYKWYWQTASNGTSTSNSTNTYSASTSGTFTFYVNSKSTCSNSWSSGAAATATVTVTNLSAPTTTFGNVCTGGGNTGTVSATPSSGADKIKWYSASSGGTALATSNTYSAVVQSTTTFYASSYNSSNGCESSSRAIAKILVNPLPASPTISGPSSICGSGSVSLSGTVGSGGDNIKWYQGGAFIISGTSYAPSLTATTTYTATTINSSSQCESAAASLTITVNSVPAPPTVPTPNPVCINSSISLAGTVGSGGTSIKWYSSPTGGSVLYTGNTYSPTINPSATYYAESVSSANCPSSTRTGVAGSFYPEPIATNLTATSVCNSGTSLITGSPGTNGTSLKVYDGALQTSNLLNSFLGSSSYTTPVLHGTTTYYVAAFNSQTGCESEYDDRMPVTAVVKSLPAPPTLSSITTSTNVCGPKTLSFSTPPSGVQWYWQGTNSIGQDNSNSQSFTASNNGSITYYLTSYQASTGCWSFGTGVTPIVDNPPAPAPTNTSFVYCEGPSGMPMALSGSVYPTLNWYDQNNTLKFTGGTYSPTNIDNGTYTYFVKNLSTNNCESSGATSITLQVGGPTANCDQLVNWSENISHTYSTSSDFTGTLTSDSKTYSDGFGNIIQSQTKSFVNNQVLAAESIYDSRGHLTLTTLPAPINSSSLGYRYRFTTKYDPATNSYLKYSWSDFDAAGGKGSVNSPNQVGNNGPGTLGWYYSTANYLEPNTATSNFPYSRTYTPPVPDPVNSKSAGPGDAFVMGGGHEVLTSRSLIDPSELLHYYSLRPFFNSNPINNFQVNISNAGQNPALFSTTSSGITNIKGNNNNSVWHDFVSLSSDSSHPGIYPINGTITVVPGTTCTFIAQCNVNSNATAKLHVTDASGNDILWGATVPSLGNNNTISSTFIVPANVTTIKIGIQYYSSVYTGVIYVSSVQFINVSTSSSPIGTVGYKILSTDPDGKMTATFSDADGHTLASALVTSVSGTAPNQTATYDNTTWSYTFYNDMGQLVASVPPNGVNTSSTAMPMFVTTYKYDQLGRLIQTTSPDEGTSNFVYSTDGKIRFSQNQLQASASPQRFSYTNYDYLGRLVESGEYTSSVTNPFVFEPTADSPSSPYSVLSIVDINIPQGYDVETITSTPGASYFNGPSYTLDNARCSDYTFIKYDNQQADLPQNDSNHASQNNLLGQVAKTENANAITWYSYDEFGNVEWTVQSIAGLGDSKTIDYTYDFLSNVTQVVYQKGKSDSFYHYYTYNADNQLIGVSTSLDGTSKTDQAKYYYYLHGPLKRVELATNLQGIDYVYTINGALKSINHVDQTNDPGNDAPESNGFSRDVFGSTLNYYNDVNIGADYTGAGYNAGTFSTSGLTDYYGGQIKSAAWFTPVDGAPSKKMYGYNYDKLNRFSSAQWGTVGGNKATGYTGTLSSSQYKENIGSYDNNGNIFGLTRTDKNGNTIGNYKYNYANPQTNTQTNNQLQNVSDQVTGNVLTAYQYNTIGQMIQQVEGSTTMKVYYNAYGLSKEVRDGNNNLMVSYYYDDRGDRVKQIIYINGAPAKTTYYVRDVSGNPLAIYEQNGNNSVALVEQPIYGAGRIGTMKPKGGQPKYFYEMQDHLGNVRTVIGAPYTDNFIATMEPANANVETKQFVNITATDVPYASANTTVGGSYVSRLNAVQNGGVPAHIMGPGTVLAVAPGDVISASVKAYYEASSGNGTSALTAAQVTSAVVSAFTGGMSPTEASAVQSAFTQAYSTGGVFVSELGTGSDNVPHAYLNMIMFDGNLLPDPLLPSVAIPITSASLMSPQPYSFSNIQITSPGYVFIYVSVDGNSPNYVYFDDLQVSHTHSPYVAGGDFYPFGLTMDDRQIKAERYRFGYQGQFAEKDSLTNWNAFQLRMYEPRYGRWISPDPKGQFNSPYIGMGNDPIGGFDPDGAWWIFGGPGVSFVEWFRATILHDGELSEPMVNGRRVYIGAGAGADREDGYLSGISKNAKRNWNGVFTFMAKNGAQLGGHVDGIVSTMTGKTPSNPEDHAWSGYYKDGQDFGLSYTSTAISAVVTLFSGGMAGPGFRPVGITQTGAVPLIQPVAVPVVKATSVHGRINASSDSEVPEGYKETKEFGRMHGQKVYQKGNDYISKDVDSHSGGVWKVFRKVGGRLKRIGTADKDLNIFKD